MAACLHLLVHLPRSSKLNCLTVFLWKQAADKLVKIWDAYTGEILKTFESHHEGINDVAWSSEGDFLASASDDKSIILWDMEQVRLRNLVFWLDAHSNTLGKPCQSIPRSYQLRFLCEL